MATKQKQPDQDVVAKLAERGEATLHRLADLPGGAKAIKAFNDLKVRVDDLTRRVRGIDALEERVAKLEKELSTLKRSRTQKAPATKTTSRKPSAS